MKQLITILFTSLAVLFVNLNAQEIQIADGATVILNTNYSSTITSQTMNNNSTAILNLNANLNLSSDISNFYGRLVLGNGYTANLLSATSIGGKINLSNSYTAATTLVKKNSAFTIAGYDGSNNSIVLGTYGVLNLTSSENDGKLILAKNLYLDGYINNAPLIKFKPTAKDGTRGTPGYNNFIEVTDGNIYSDDATNSQIHLNKHIEVDLGSVSTTGLTPGTTYYFTLATGSSAFNITGTPNVINNDAGYWTNITGFSADLGVGKYCFGISADYTAAFQNDLGEYYATFAGLLSSGYSADAQQLMVGNYTLNSNVSLTSDLVLKMGDYTFSSNSAYITISASKTFTVMSGGSGVFNGQISFADNTSDFSVLSGANLLGTGFSVSATSSGAGRIIIGDGTTAVTQALKASQLNNKVSTVIVKGNVTYTVSSELDKSGGEQKINTKKTNAD